MYHARFNNSHYEAGFHWGNLLYKHGKKISNNHTFVITEERRKFVKECIPIYEQYYPEILEEKCLKRMQDLDLKYNYIYIGKCMIKLLYIDFKWSEIA